MNFNIKWAVLLMFLLHNEILSLVILSVVAAVFAAKLIKEAAND